MADDPKKKGKDGKLVSSQPHELSYLQKKTGKSAKAVKAAIDKAGPSRKKVMKALAPKKKP